MIEKINWLLKICLLVVFGYVAINIAIYTLLTPWDHIIGLN